MFCVELLLTGLSENSGAVRGRDRMVVTFTTTCAITAYRH